MKKSIPRSQVGDALKNARRPDPETVIRFGDRAKRLWCESMAEYGVVRQEPGFELRYVIDTDVVNDPNHPIWEAVTKHYLLSLAVEPGRAPRQSHSDTSTWAAESIREKTGTLRQQVLLALRKQPMTDVEISEYLGIPGSTVRPRRVELMNMGLVREVGYKKVPGHKMSRLWEAV